MRFFDKFAETAKGLNRLPHWSQQEATYFVTFRLADSIPQVMIENWKAERERWICGNPEPWDATTEGEYHRKFSGRLDRIMDEGHGSYLLRIAKYTETCRRIFDEEDGKRYTLHSWVVMPNHVHVLFSIIGDRRIDAVVGAWKRRSSRAIHELRGESGALWQKDYFDRIIRDWDHFMNVARYIRRNPVKAKLWEGEFLLWESDEGRRMLG